MDKLMETLAAIKPQGVGDFAYEIFSGLLSDCNDQFYCSNLLEGLKVIADKEQEILSSGDYNPDENLMGLYVINNRDFYLDNLADKLKDVKTAKKIMHDNWGHGYDVIGNGFSRYR